MYFGDIEGSHVGEGKRLNIWNGNADGEVLEAGFCRISGVNRNIDREEAGKSAYFC
jgi:hypothetical protein